jgi:hypothetical protein
MISRKLILALACCALPALGAAALAVQDNGMPPPAKPSPEHALLKERVGTWDAVVQMTGAPAPSKAVETNRMLGQFHVLSSFQGDMMGSPFEGQGITSWDPNKKKFISIWTDTMEPTPAVMEGTHDPKAHTLTFTGEVVSNGQRSKMREVITSKDADHATFEMYATGPDGKEAKMMQIDYTRRK